MKHLLMLPLLLATAPVMAQDYYQPGGTQQTACYETVYREEYVPGTKDNTGYVRTFRERVAVPCEDETPIRQSYDPRRQNEDTNSCIEGSVIDYLVVALVVLSAVIAGAGLLCLLALFLVGL